MITEKSLFCEIQNCNSVDFSSGFLFWTLRWDCQPFLPFRDAYWKLYCSWVSRKHKILRLLTLVSLVYKNVPIPSPMKYDYSNRFKFGYVYLCCAKYLIQKLKQIKTANGCQRYIYLYWIDNKSQACKANKQLFIIYINNTGQYHLFLK